MGSPYSSQSVSNYNSNPPPDDGSETEANEITWATIKEKLTDPLNAQTSAQESAISTGFGKVVGGAGITSVSATYTVLSTDQGKLVRATVAGITITTPDAADVGEPFVFAISNETAGDITIDGSGSQTIDGAATQIVPSGAGLTLFTNGSNWFSTGKNYRLGRLPRGYIDGCTLSNNATDATNDINIAAGVCRDSSNSVDITVAAMTGKQLDANWVPGASAGMRNSAAGIADTTYHIYAVAKADGTQDIYAHTSTVVATVLTALQAESGGAEYIYARRIGSIMRASASIVGFSQNGDEFLRKGSIIDVSVGNPGTSAVLRTMSVPVGIVVWHIGNWAVRADTDTASSLYVSSPDVNDEPPGTTGAPLGTIVHTDEAVANMMRHNGNPQTTRTNTSAQVRTRISVSSAAVNLYGATLGWIDRRGRE